MALLKMIFPRAGSRTTQRRALTALLVLFLCPLAYSAPAEPKREYQVKAVFLFNFSRFVEWPADAFPNPDSPLIIGVLGQDPFGPALDETVAGERTGSHELQVRRWQRVEDIDTCHILFIGRSQAAGLDEILAHLKDRNILTVSDADGSAQRGVMIRLVTESNRIRLQINLEAARAAGLVISSKLLRPAIIVSSNTEGP
jgi:hypothetical protein